MPKKSKPTGALGVRVAPLNIPLQVIHQVRSAMPPTLRLSDNDCVVLLFAERNRNIPFAHWPKEYRHYKALAKLNRRGYLGRADSPKRFYITPSGYSLARWILAALEHRHQA